MGRGQHGVLHDMEAHLAGGFKKGSSTSWIGGGVGGNPTALGCDTGLAGPEVRCEPMGSADGGALEAEGWTVCPEVSRGGVFAAVGLAEVAYCQLAPARSGDGTAAPDSKQAAVGVWHLFHPRSKRAVASRLKVNALIALGIVPRRNNGCRKAGPCDGTEGVLRRWTVGEEAPGWQAAGVAVNGTDLAHGLEYSVIVIGVGGEDGPAIMMKLSDL